MRSSVFAAALVSMSSVSVQAHPKKHGCLDVSARLNARAVLQGCDSPIGLCTEGTLTSKHGTVIGRTRFTALSASSSAGMPTTEPGTSLSYSGVLVITTPLGSASFSDLGLYDMALGVYTEMARSPQGTLFVSGTSPDGGLTFKGEVSGELCAAKIARSF